MEQAALRPKPLPGGASGASGGSWKGCGKGSWRRTRKGSGGGPARPRQRREHAARRRGKRLVSALLGLLVGTVLVLSGVGLGAVGATLAGAGRLPGLHPGQAGAPAATAPSVSPRPTASAAGVAPVLVPVVARLGVEVADDRRPGALVVGVHIPGPGFSAGLVRGDVLLAFGRTRIDSAADLARAVVRARPGKEVRLTVRHRSGGYQQLTVVPGVVT
ncbi:PDZ domain-containing protein [Streptomyces sp. NPDC052013]|uniref:PDZ domain-containing protein n=1 Tax=Streptomyces sp. NPDC052013 TaxID=3365679 RepID=UPI0037D03550